MKREHHEQRNKVVPLWVATPAKGHPSYKVTTLGNKLCITVFDIPSREATPLIRPDFPFSKGRLIIADHCTKFIHNKTHAILDLSEEV